MMFPIKFNPFKINSFRRNARPARPLQPSGIVPGSASTSSGLNRVLILTTIAEWEPSAGERELIRHSWCDDFEFLFQLGSSVYSRFFAKYCIMLSPVIG